MPKLFATVICLTLLVSPAHGSEVELIKLLESPDTPPAAKDEACQKLKLTATAAAIPALATLLADPALSHSARYALESIDAPEAAAALRDALPKATGLVKAGIIESLGQRRDRQAVEVLKELARDNDEHVAAAAVTALGRIGGAEAVGALRAARSSGRKSISPVVLDAMLSCADGMLAAGFRQDATRVYREVHNAEETPEANRTAAYRGLILAAGDEGLSLMENALNGTDRADILASLRLVPELEGSAATAALAAIVSKLRPSLQVALLEGLIQRGDPSGTSAIAAIAHDAREPADVRVAALRAIGLLGDASVVPLLSTMTAADDGAIQDAARQALVRLKGEGVRDAIIERIGKAESPVRIELIRILGRRYESRAANVLMRLTDDTDDSVRSAAFQSLAIVGDDSLITPLVRMMTRVKQDDRRAAAERTLRAIAARAADPEQAARALSVGLAVADPVASTSLLRVASAIPAPQAAAALRDATRSIDPTVADAAVRALASSPFSSPQDLLAIARDAARTDDQRIVALRGCVRLADEDPAASPTQRTTLLKDVLAAATRVEEKRLVLSSVARISDVFALAVAEAALSDKSVTEEAALACLQIARAVSKSNPAEARAAAEKIIASGAADSVLTEAKALRDRIGR